MNNEILSTKQCGKTLASMIESVKNITPTDDYILYIRQDIFDKYISELDKYIPINVEVEATSYLPNNISAVYMKKVDWRTMAWYEK